MIKEFSGEFAFLSNFFPSPMLIRGKEWPTVEHLFQAMKTKSPIEREKIRLCETPGKAKRMGKKVMLRSDWFEIRESVMTWCIKLKFQSPELRKKLLETGTTQLVEGNVWHDNFWGSCQCPKCIDKNGINMLGIILMKERERIRNDN